MGFVIVEPGRAGFDVDPLAEGSVAVRRSGDLIALRDDLSLVSIGDCCTVLADAATKRIALRAPTDDEAANAQAVLVLRRGNKQRDDSGRRRIMLKRALARIGLTPEQAVGRYELTTKENLLILNLSEVGGPASIEKNDKAKSRR